jgi:hypothetical protein
MKKLLGSLILLTGLTLSTLALSPVLCDAQPRNAGKMVVPVGYESADSVRWAIYNAEFARFFLGGYPGSTSNYLMNAYMDSVQATFEGGFLSQQRGVVFGGKRKGTSLYFDNYYYIPTTAPTYFPIQDLARNIKSRTFYPSPSGALNFSGLAHGNYWRYNDVNFNPNAKWYDNTYDANDISPYCEYPKKDAYVIDTFSTRNYNNTTDTLVHYGDKGRVILGYSDDRLANQLLYVDSNYFFHYSPTQEIANTFSVNVDFNISESSIDTALAAGRPDSILPLMTLQVLFKRGSTISPPYPGQPILPFIPFADAVHPSNPGWYKVAEVVVTKHVYDSLISDNDYSWKAEDTLQNGLPSHPWRFVQLHLMLNLPSVMSSLITSSIHDYDWGNWGQGSGAEPLTTFANPDNVVAMDGIIDTGALTAATPLIEIRILSTYRDTVRIRGLDYHDTVADKFLYRKRFAGTTHSCNPDGSIGGYDSLLVDTLSREFDTSHYVQEFLFNDVADPREEYSTGCLSVPMMGYLDFMGSNHNLRCHWRQLLDGSATEQYRRFRMIYDGQVPSMIENQWTFFGGSGALLFPSDYVYYDSVNPATAPWPSSGDIIAGLTIARRDTTTGFRAYQAYYNANTNPDHFFNSTFCLNMRSTSRSALWHPNNKRFAVEASLQGWAAMIYNWTTDTAGRHYDKTHGYNDNNSYERPTTPEETLGMGYCAIANGITCFNNAQAIDVPDQSGGDPGLYTFALRTNPLDTNRIVHNYNVGHQYTPWDVSHWLTPTSSDISGNMPPFYLGYSNNWRSQNLLMSRINAIYDSTNGRKCPHPLKYMTWQDAYSNAQTGTNSSGDSLTRANAFLKIGNTFMVKRYTRGPGNSFIDSTVYDALVSNRQVEVGLFKDSISSTNINHAALVVNTRFWPSLVDTADMNYYNQGLDTLSMCHTTLGDIDTRKVTMQIDTNVMESGFRCPLYVVRDLWHPDSSWFVAADTDFSIYLKPGDAKFLYFEKVVGLSTGLMTTNVYNNARHIAAREINDSLAYYSLTYEKTGNIYVAYPIETPDSLSKRINGTPSDTKIEGNGLSHTPSVSVNVDSNSGIAIVYSIDSAGSSHDSTFIIFRHANFSTPTVFTKDTLDKFSIVAEGHPLLGYVSAPAVMPAHSGYGKFWVTWTRPDSGGAVALVDTLGNHVPQRYFYKTPSDAVQLVSPATHLKFSSDHGSAVDTCFLSFQVDGIYYTKVWIDPINPNQIDTIPYFEVSYGNPLCSNYHPCTSVTEYGTVEIVWEAQFWNDCDHYAMERWRLGDSSWSVFSDFMAYHGCGFPSVVYPSNALTDMVSMNPLSTNWRDFQRIAWNNPVDDHLYIVHRGLIGAVLNWRWFVDKMYEVSQEPSLPVHTEYQNAVPYAIMYRSGAQNDDGTFNAEITKYDFPVTPVVSDSLPHGTFYATTDGHDCHPGLLGSIGTVNVIRTGTSVLKIGVIPVDTIPVDTLHIGYRLDWKHPVTPTKNFKLLTGDLLDYQRYFRAGNYNLGDTTTAGIGLSSSSDYLKMQVVLRDAATHGVVTVLDTARLTIDGLHRGVFVWSGSVADSGNGSYFVSSPITDSVYMTLEVSRGDTMNSYQLFYAQTYLSTSILQGAGPVGTPKVTAQHPVQSQVSHLSMSIYPNPTNRETTIEAHTADGIPTRIDLYDVLGNRLRTLFDDLSPNGGRITLRLDCAGLPQGSYFLRTNNGNEVLTRRIQLLK